MNKSESKNTTKSGRLVSLRKSSPSNGGSNGSETAPPIRRKFAPNAAPRRTTRSAADSTQVDQRPRERKFTPAARIKRHLQDGRRREAPSGKVAFVGAKAAGAVSVKAEPRQSPIAGHDQGALNDIQARSSEENAQLQWPPEVKSIHQPITFPFGNPNSGTAASKTYAEVLSKDGEIMFVQLPTRLPFVADNKTDDAFGDVSKLGISGRIGKVQVHRSGKMTLRIGDIPLDVSVGICPSFYEEVCVLNRSEKTMDILGQTKKHLVVTPNFNAMLK